MGRPGLGLSGVNIRMFRCGGWRFRLTATYFFTSAKKSKQKTLAPAFGPRRLGFLRCGIDPGAAATVCFAAPPSAVSGCARRSLRSHARINPSTQPSDVAGGSRSRALELALIVECGGFAAGICAALLLLLILCEPAREGGLTADPFLAGRARSNCRREPAREGGLTADPYLSETTRSLWELACQR